MERIALLFFLFITLWGCDKKTSVVSIVEPPPVIVQPKVELTISPLLEVLPYGSDITITWKGIDSKYCLYNDVKVENSGSITLKKVIKETSVSLKAVNDNLISETVNKTLKVGDWTTSVFGILSHSTWLQKSTTVYQNGVIVFDVALNEEQKTIVYTFTSNGKMTGFNTAGQQTLGCDYALLENNTRVLMGDQNYLIVSITPEKLVCRLTGTFNGLPAFHEDIYGRP